MKWKLGSSNSSGIDPKNEIAEIPQITKPMSYFADKSEIIAGNKFSPTKLSQSKFNDDLTLSPNQKRSTKLNRTSSVNINNDTRTVLEQQLLKHQEKLQQQLEKQQKNNNSTHQQGLSPKLRESNNLLQQPQQSQLHLNNNFRASLEEAYEKKFQKSSSPDKMIESTTTSLKKSPPIKKNKLNSSDYYSQNSNDNQIFTITSTAIKNKSNNSNNSNNSNHIFNNVNNISTSTSIINRTNSLNNGSGGGGGIKSYNHHQPLHATTSSGTTNTLSTINDTSPILDNHNFSSNHNIESGLNHHFQHQDISNKSSIKNDDDDNQNHHQQNSNYANTTITNKSSNGSIDKAGSTAKLIPVADDQPSTQSKCSIFRNLVLCICLNITYANIVRFPRELDRYGLAFLIPYLLLLFLVGFPLILLEIAVGQFLGQGAAHTWRSSPILKGACIVSRFASWLATIWISLQAVVAGLYIGIYAFKSIPFSDCVEKLKIFEKERYKILANDGQDCIKKTFLRPVWSDPVYYGLMIMFLLLIWVIAMFCTHSAKIYRRTTFFFGLFGFGLLIALTSWEVQKSLESNYFPKLWPFNENYLTSCVLWFSALVQVIYSTNIGFGILPVITGKFLYKGDAVRTSFVYLCFNLLVNAISVTLFMVYYDSQLIEEPRNVEIPELKSLTTIYDKLLEYYKESDGNPKDMMITKLAACLLLLLIVISSIVSIATAIYTSSRLVPKHPNYVMCLVGLSVGVAALVCPEFKVVRILDSRIVGTLVISALIFDLIATVWVYGKKNIYTDLEFSIGRPIFKGWLYLWILAPVLPTAILVWWCVGDDQNDVLYLFLPRWGPIAFVLLVIILMAAIEIFRQVDYNFFGMICEAAKPAKEWGPADPLARHAWKQWRSVCQDTGRKDFTLRRRGTRDYTHSIKKGQYSTRDMSTKLGTPTTNWKSVSTPGSNSPNYSGSVFGDSAIEEDMSVDKYSGVNHNFPNPFQQNSQHNNDMKTRYSSNRSRKISHEKQRHHHSNYHTPYPPSVIQQMAADKQQLHQQRQSSPQHLQHKEILYIRRLSNDSLPNHSTRIEITPSSEAITYAATRNPMGRTLSNVSAMQHYKIASNPGIQGITREKREKQYGSRSGGDINRDDHKKSNPDFDHICWRKFSVNSEEYSTEL